MKNKLLLCSLALAGVQAMSQLSAQCQAGFTYSVNNNVVTFTNTSTGPSSADYWWKFGDGSSSSSQNPVHTYAYNGNYVVCLSMIDSSASNCYSYFCDTITITGVTNPPCNLVTSVTSTPASCSTCNDGSATVNVSGGTPPYVYWWSNGSAGQTAAGLASGTYYVAVSDANGCADSAQVTITFKPKSASCVAGITGNTTIQVGGTTLLKAWLSPNCLVKTYLWSTGATTASISVAPNVTTFYSVVVCCPSTNCCDTAGVAVYVQPSSNNCQAHFASSAAGNTVKFTDQSNTGSPIVSWSWNFGDGTYSYLQNTSHTYSQPGLYLACLTIYLADSSSCYSCDSIVIGSTNPPCNLVTSLTSTPASCNTCNDGSATVSVAGGTAPYVYWWSNGSTSQTAAGLSPGTYYVVVSDASGCADTASIMIGGNAPCSASIILAQDTIKNPLFWYAYVYVTGVAPFSYLWDFGDGTTSTQPYPSHTYAAPGTYLICLTITDAAGCSSTTCDSTYKIVATGVVQYLEVVDPATTSIEENTVSVNSVFPNPSNDMIEVSLSQFVEGELRITDITGREVYSENINANNIKVNVSTLPIGYYNLSILSGAGTTHTKVMIAR